ncbi:hypothetical protein N8611_02525, partial [bacterium]|nr:hypothetical protein [bacterium]
MFDENSSDNIGLKVDFESDGKLLSDSRAAAARIALFEFYDCSDDLSAWTFWTRLRLSTAREKESVFLADKEL